MSQAEIIETVIHVPRIVTQTVFDRVVTQKVNLELSMAEAQTILTVCMRVGGDPDTTPRKFTDSVGAALRRVGVQDIEAPRGELIDEKERSINFQRGSIEYVQDK